MFPSSPFTFSLGSSLRPQVAFKSCGKKTNVQAAAPDWLFHSEQWCIFIQAVTCRLFLVSIQIVIFCKFLQAAVNDVSEFALNREASIFPHGLNASQVCDVIYMQNALEWHKQMCLQHWNVRGWLISFEPNCCSKIKIFIKNRHHDWTHPRGQTGWLNFWAWPLMQWAVWSLIA